MHSSRLLQITVALMLVGTIFGMSSYLRPSKVTTNCCKRVSRRPIPHHITHYRIQNNLYPCVEAVIFYTLEKGPLCSNPTARWVPKKIKEINNRVESGST
ncbi:C-C motif chemokine 8-like isoform X2 [Narcine bancroftii]|uniref:C-C motif chemokine 8-like isoform X2 n=1 Tax=Narcine bancroftii TaxID=1343680 RepID=UPI003831BB28